TVLTVLNKMALSALAFVYSALFAHLLSPPDRVEFQLSGTIAQTGMTFVGGLSNYFAYAYPKFRDDRCAVVQTGNLVVGTACLLVWGITCLWWALQPVPWHLPRPWAWALLCMPVTFVFGYGSRLLQAADEMTWLNRANALQPALFTAFAAVLFIVRRHSSSTPLLTATYSGWVLTNAVAATLSMVWARRQLRLPRMLQWRGHRRHLCGALRYGGWSALAQVVSIANYRMDFWLVYALLPRSVDASVYGIAVVAAEVLLNISTAISSVVFAQMTGGERANAERLTEDSTRHTLISSAVAALGMYLTFPWLIVLAFGHAYTGAIGPFFLLLPGLIAKAASNLVIQYATNTLGHARASVWMNGLSAVLNALCCLLCIPAWGTLGAALASTLSYGLSFVVYAWWYQRQSGRPASALVRVRCADLVPYWHVVQQVCAAVLSRRSGR
ncbi:MAG: polysaccharide biosynthesis C-terminal domain-containing protein, partial [Alicyclobacillus sp.]|nr:polysaccharide biosynthesis C-terminal domain-containing protein [Alicyclobacillus sp.]